MEIIVGYWETGNAFQWMHPSKHPTFTGDWKDSLCVRPEVKA